MDDSELPPTYDITERLQLSSEQEEDFRITCTNSDSLNKILQISIDQAIEVAETNNLVGIEKERYVRRFTEVFRTNLQSNVTVNGLPWDVNVSTLSQEEKKQLANETDDVLLSMLANKVERIGRKRKKKDPMRVLEMQFKHRRLNLRKLRIEPSVELPSFSQSSPLSQPFPHETLAEICKDISCAQGKVDQVCGDLPSLESKLEYILDVIKSNKERDKEYFGDDTGYNSA